MKGGLMSPFYFWGKTRNFMLKISGVFIAQGFKRNVIKV
jgi:hypothetical protein